MVKRIRLLLVFVLGFTLVGSSVFAAVFTPQEYSARRARLMEKIPDGVAIFLGAKAIVDYNEYYQNNDFIYFTGVEIPDAILIIDGQRKQSIIFYSISEREAQSRGISTDYVLKPRETT